MNKQEIISTLQRCEPKSMRNALPVVWKSAKNDVVKDVNGKKYIDFTSTIFVQNFGHSNKRVKNYIQRQLNRNLLHSYTFAHEVRAELLNKLTYLTGFEKAFLLSSGTEATEAAVKLMRMYGKSKGKRKIISFEGAMHGRTMAASIMKNDSEYDHPDFIRLQYPNEDDVFNTDLSDVAGVMIETYQGWSAKFMPKEYVQELVKVCKDNDVLVCFDEIQSGFYRCGTLFGYYNYYVKPNLICVGKALGGGLPISGVLGSKEILDVPNAGDMSSTHSANPLCCAAALAVVEEVLELNTETLVGKCKYFESLLNKIAGHFKNVIKKVVCNGMVGSLIFNDSELASKVCRICAERGLLLVYTGRESVKFGPPITITRKNLKKGFEIIEGVLNEYC